MLTYGPQIVIAEEFADLRDTDLVAIFGYGHDAIADR